MFRYERLLDICFVCGCLDHQESESEEAVKARKIYSGVVREYGLWLKADGQHPKVGDNVIQCNDGIRIVNER